MDNQLEKCKSKGQAIREKCFAKELNEQLRESLSFPPLQQTGVHPPQGRSLVLSCLVSGSPAGEVAVHAVSILTLGTTSPPAPGCQHHYPNPAPLAFHRISLLCNVKPSAAFPGSYLSVPHCHLQVEGSCAVTFLPYCSSPPESPKVLLRLPRELFSFYPCVVNCTCCPPAPTPKDIKPLCCCLLTTLPPKAVQGSGHLSELRRRPGTADQDVCILRFFSLLQ